MKNPKLIILYAALLLAAGGRSISTGASAADPRRPLKRSAGRQPEAAEVQRSKPQSPNTQSQTAQVQRSKPQPQNTHYQAARAALLKGDLATASREVKLALQDNPLDAESHFMLGCLLQAKGETDQAVVGFQRSLEIDPVRPDAQYNLGTMLLWRGEAVRASGLLENAVLTRPDHVPSYNNLAKAYFLAGLPDLAVATYEEALRRDAANAIALRNLLLLVEAAGDRDATATYRRRLDALRLSPAAMPLAGGGAPMMLSSPRPMHMAAVAGEQPVVIGESLIPPPEPRAGDDTEVKALQELLRDLPNVKAERRGGRLILTGWTTGPNERAMLDRILGKPPGAQGKSAPAPVGRRAKMQEMEAPGAAAKSPAILDLTSDDSGDPQRMIEIDAVLFIMKGLDQQSVGFNFLRAVQVNFGYGASGNQSRSDASGFSDLSGFNTRGSPVSTIGQPSANGSPSWATTGPIDELVASTVSRGISQLSQEGWVFGAAVDYVVNIANAADERVAVLARPHLTALSGTPAKFLAGGELVYTVSGINSGDIKPYPFGTTLEVTPTLLRSPAEDGTPRVHLTVDAGRTSVLSLLGQQEGEPTAFEKVTVASEAVLRIGQTLILSGLNQRESRSGRSGVPILKDVPVLKYLFSTKSTIDADTAVIILLTPRDPAFWDEQYLRSTQEFVEKRRAFIRARQGTEEDMRRFRERYPDWAQIPPSRFASHFIMLENSEIYRAVSGQSLTGEDVDLELLGPKPKR